MLMTIATKQLIDYEEGFLDESSTIALFQNLIDTGLLQHLQGHYGRTAIRLVAAGLCTPQRTQQELQPKHIGPIWGQEAEDPTYAMYGIDDGPAPKDNDV